MSYPPPEQLPQTPSHVPPQHSLSIRTSAQPPQNPTNSTQSSPNQQQQPYPTYPLPIPPEKFSRAVELYGKLRLVQGLAQRDKDRAPPSARNYLNVPKHNGPPSVTSHTSSGGPQTPSLSASAYGAGTTESVLSFDDEGSPSSATANASSEFTAYDGRRVRPRQRNRLSPEAKAKAALIRHLGSCWVCRSRRVPCPLEHIDTKALDAGLRAARPLRNAQSTTEDATSSRRRSQTQPNLTRPLETMASNSIGVGRSQSQRDRQQPTTFSHQNAALFGLGQQPDLLNFGLHDTPSSHSHSPTIPDNLMDPLASIDAMSQYTSYQDGYMFRLGVLNGYFFYCRHIGSNCQGVFHNAEELQLHFETAHFAFTRINPAFRYHCPGCNGICLSANGPCEFCRLVAAKELWVYGRFIRVQSYDRYDPDGQDLYSALEDPFLALGSDYSPGLSPGAGFGPSNHGPFNLNLDNFNNDFFHDNTYPDPGPQGNDVDEYNSQQGFQYQGNQFGKEADVYQPPASNWFSKALQAYQRYKLISIAISLLLAAVFTVQTHDWFVAKGESIHIYAHLPFIGFIGLVASFFICRAYWSKRCRYFTPNINSQRRLSSTLFPINNLSTSASTINFQPAAPRAASLIRAL